MQLTQDFGVEASISLLTQTTAVPAIVGEYQARPINSKFYFAKCL